VKNTVLGGINLGYFVFLLVDAIKGVDVKPGDSDQAIEDMQRAGAVAITLEDMIEAVLKNPSSGRPPSL
jgi:nicotinamidase/pyrazinamidase